MKYFIGLDQSYNSFGCCIIDERFNLLHYETFGSPKDKDIFERAWHLTSHVKDIVLRFQPCSICIEGLAFGMRGDATRDLAGLQFSVVNILRFSYNQNINVIAPLSLKKFVTKSGKATKEQMVEALPENILNKFLEKHKKTTGLYDLSDSYWLSRYCLDNFKANC
jgi:Holliday junction resolvasome RuvABC endonuclease subunit